MPATVRTITARPQVGDLVQSSGHLWEVEEVCMEHALSNRVAFFGVVNFPGGNRPNALRPAEVQTVHRVDARRLRAEAAR